MALAQTRSARWRITPTIKYRNSSRITPVVHELNAEDIGAASASPKSCLCRACDRRDQSFRFRCQGTVFWTSLLYRSVQNGKPTYC